MENLVRVQTHLKAAAFPILFGAAVVSVMTADTSAESQGIPLSIRANAVSVGLILDGEGPRPFLLDMNLDRPVLFYRADTARVPGAPAKDEQPTRSAEIALPGAETARETFVVAKMPPGRSRYEEPAGAISGKEFGPRFCLDFPAREVRWPESAAFKQAFPDREGLPLRRDAQGTLAISATVDGKHVWPFLLDAACPDVMQAPRKMLKESGLLVQGTLVLKIGRGSPDMPAPEACAWIRVKAVRAGRAELRDPLCAVSDAPDAVPRIGLGFLRLFRIGLDLERMKIWFVPAGHLPALFPPMTGCGMTPSDKDNGSWRVWVAENSPAARAGVRSGAILISVNDRAMAGQPLDTVLESLACEAGAHLQVKVSQEGALQTLDLLAERLL